MICLMPVSEKQQNIFKFRYKILKIGIFGKLIGGFENFLRKKKNKTKMHSKIMADKKSQICLLYFQFVCKNFLILIFQVLFSYF